MGYINRKNINFLKKNGYYKYPLTMQLEITRDCPFNCPQCYKTELGNKNMDFEVLKKNISEGLTHGVNLFVLNGGEPLLYPNYVDALELLKEKNVNVNCFSSGYGLTDDILTKIKEMKNLNFYISLNGSTKKINDLSRQGYAVSIKAIKKLSDNDCKFGINWVARGDNLDDFPEMIELCKKYNISTLSVTSNKLAKNKSKIMSGMVLNDIKKLAEYIKKFSDRVNISIEACFPQLTSQFRKLMDSDGCAAGYYNVNISLEGMYLPCTHLYYPEEWNSIEEYWEKSPMLNKLRKNAKCNNCELNCRFCKAMSKEGYDDYSRGISFCKE